MTKRVSDLTREGLWSEKRLPKVCERPRPRTHWDSVLTGNMTSNLFQFQIDDLYSSFYIKYMNLGGRKALLVYLNYFSRWEESFFFEKTYSFFYLTNVFFFPFETFERISLKRPVTYWDHFLCISIS